MPAWLREQGGPLTSKQITTLVNGIEENWAKPARFQGTELPSYSVGNQTGDVSRGRRLFARDCFLCHGQPAIGSVTDKTFLQLVSDQVLRTSIIVGRDDLGPVKMPNYQTLNVGRPLSNQDIDDIVAYLASLRPNVAVQNITGSRPGRAGQLTRGNEGSGNGPGSPRQEQNEGKKSQGSSSQRGGK
jgi:cytochrome c oxidase cbb3-type subunit 3/ubiquinol-cytochrome c reductase cytochrome c subunit